MNLMKTTILALIFQVASLALVAQVAVTTDGAAPHASAMLEVKSASRGFLMPRLTHQQIATLPDPADGLQVYNKTNGKVYVFVASTGQWREVSYGSGVITPPFSCGMSLTINHTTGAVAPVNKTVTYGTVTNIPGEPSKCWITHNLGADNQASAVDDATEPSAGWYWQFNLKRGFKHDGTTRTPATTWITTISESTDWTAANDPCTIELGTGWRIPAGSEWDNVDTGGGWLTWSGPWESDLKLHAAGNLSHTDGGLHWRGTYGYYWSSSQLSVSWGQYLKFFSSGCFVQSDLEKAKATPLRCIRE